MKFISLLIALVMVVPLFQGTYTSQCPKSKENHSSLSIRSLLNRYVVVYGIGFGFVTSGSFGERKKVKHQDKDEDITDIITSEGEEGWLEKVLKKVKQFNLHF